MADPFNRKYETRVYEVKLKNKLPIALPATIREALCANLKEAGVVEGYTLSCIKQSDRLKVSKYEELRIKLLVKLEESIAYHSNNK